VIANDLGLVRGGVVNSIREICSFEYLIEIGGRSRIDGHEARAAWRATDADLTEILQPYL
jgi:hypothetical protein